MLRSQPISRKQAKRSTMIDVTAHGLHSKGVVVVVVRVIGPKPGFQWATAAHRQLFVDLGIYARSILCEPSRVSTASCTHVNWDQAQHDPSPNQFSHVCLSSFHFQA